MTLGELKNLMRQAQEKHPDGEFFFRLGDKDEDLLNTTSVEAAEFRNAGDIEEVVEAWGFDTLEDLQYALENYDPAHPEVFEWPMFWDDNGHFGAGIYYTGVCCCTYLEALADYVNTRNWGDEDSVVFMFIGNLLGNCVDGDVAEPLQLVTKMPRSVLNNTAVIEAIDGCFFDEE